MKYLRQLTKPELSGQRAILLADYNSPAGDTFRLDHLQPTVLFLKKRGVRVTIIRHLRRGAQTNERSFFTGEPKRNYSAIIKKLSSRADLFINDAFPVCHRHHPFVTDFPRHLPSYAGLQLEQEIKNLSRAFRPPHPFLLIIGGVKPETKIPLVKKFLKLADNIFIGGALANNFYQATGLDIGRSTFDRQVKISRTLLFNKKVILPIDSVRSGGKIVDVGPQSIESLLPFIQRARFILWNGPMGYYEGGYRAATEKLARLIARSSAATIVGGGETIDVVGDLGLEKEYTFVSTGGGAMLEFLASGGHLPGLEALNIIHSRY